MEKEQSSKSGAWENWTATCKRMTLEHYIIPYTVTPKALELNVRPEIIKFLIENKGSKLTDIGLMQCFVDERPKARETKAKINKQDYIKLKSIYTAK